ncbi:MAG: SDR family NAD(P)-dependent oxidoreductase [Proteobacteria bacterium]|nr:SDR family NAD(P)-dependent oxidoreductase [Pseudomonadota bacterium]
MRSFENKVAVITGAASGIGRALAQQLAQRGAELALVDVNASALAETAASVAATGRRVTTHIVDVADAARMEALAETVVAQHGRVELLVNNAGVSVTGTFEEQSLDDWRWIVGVNLWGVVHGCKFFLPHLRRAEEAHIVNLSSMFGLIGLPTQSSYCATKFAVRGLSEALWAELHGSGIGVTSVHPGGVKTNIVRDSRTADANAKQQMILRFDRMAMSPEKAAAKILDAALRNKLRVVICPETRVADWAKRLFPAGVHQLVERG